jgi:DNA-binding transcriptional LysR family regulator
MTDFRDLEVFFWVARLGGFRKASERLNTTQPAVSLRIAGLEERLGVKLLARGPRVTSLTPKGREFLDYAERLLRLRSEMLNAVASPATMSGVVRLGVAETIVHTWLARFIERVHDAYPNVTLDIEVDVSPRLRDALVGNEIDLAFLLGPVSEPRMVNLDLSRYPLSFVANPALDLGPEPVPLERLTRLPLITYPKTTRPYIALRQLLTRSECAAPRIYSNSSLSTIVRMTLDGIGISVIPAVVIGPELERGDLRLIRADVELPDLVFTATSQITPDSSPAERLARLACEVAAQSDKLR